GRRSSPKSHYLYIASCATKAFSDPTAEKEESMLVEIRSTGAQTIFPGSAHEDTGESISWDSNDEPTHAANLEREVGVLAAAAILARHWSEGQRDFIAASLAAILNRVWEPDRTSHFIRSIARVVGDEEHQSRDRKAYSKPGGKKYGWPKLRECVGTSVADRVKDWLALSDTKESP